MNKAFSIALGIVVTVFISGISYIAHENKERAAANYDALKQEQTYHQPTVSQCERAVTLGIQAMGAYNANNNAAVTRVYDLTASEPAVIRQNAARVETMIEAHHRMNNLTEPNQMVLGMLDKGMKLACQKQKLS